MSVTKEEVNNIADLAHLQFNDEETEALADDMNQILEHMETLDEVDTSDVEPLKHVIEPDSQMRDDKAEEPLSHEDALKNAPDADTDYFRVPKVID